MNRAQRSKNSKARLNKELSSPYKNIAKVYVEGMESGDICVRRLLLKTKENTSMIFLSNTPELESEDELLRFVEEIMEKAEVEGNFNVKFVFLNDSDDEDDDEEDDYIDISEEEAMEIRRKCEKKEKERDKEKKKNEKKGIEKNDKNDTKPKEGQEIEITLRKVEIIRKKSEKKDAEVKEEKKKKKKKKKKKQDNKEDVKEGSNEIKVEEKKGDEGDIYDEDGILLVD
jgi:hypothetical protein